MSLDFYYLAAVSNRGTSKTFALNDVRSTKHKRHITWHILLQFLLFYIQSCKAEGFLCFQMHMVKLLYLMKKYHRQSDLNRGKNKYV